MFAILHLYILTSSSFSSLFISSLAWLSRSSSSWEKEDKIFRNIKSRDSKAIWGEQVGHNYFKAKFTCFGCKEQQALVERRGWR